MRPAVPSDGFSPGRSASVAFDYPDFALVQDPWWKTLNMLEITGAAVKEQTDGVHFVQGIGFQLETMHDRMQFVHEEDATAAKRHPIEGVLTTFEAHPLKGVPSMTGVPVGSQVEGDLFNQKMVGAGDDWSGATFNINATDGASYPGPTETEIIPLDRVFLGSAAMSPDQTLWMRFWIPELGGGASIGVIGRIYFTGLAGTPNNQQAGTGEYCLSLRADGKAQLWEKDVASVWHNRKNFRWSPAHQVARAWHVIAIRSDAWLSTSDNNWYGKVINFECQAVQEYTASDLGFGTGVAAGNSTTQYIVPQTVFPQAITQVPPRIDIRRNVRMKMSLSYTKFVASGTLQTQTFENPRSMGSVGVPGPPDPATNPPENDPPIQIAFHGSYPSGTSIDIALYTKDGTACTAYADPGTFGALPNVVWRSFRRKNKADGSPEQEYYAIATLHASGDQKNSPTLQRMTIVRDGVVAMGATGEWAAPAESILDFSILAGSMDPTLESASIGMISLQDGFTVADNGVDDPLATLTARSGQSCRIELDVPAKVVNGTSVSTSTLFLGKAQSLKRKRIGVARWNQLMRAGATALEAFPSSTWWQGRLILAGLWKRLVQGKTHQTWNFGNADPNTGQLYRVTEVIRLLLSNMGLPTKMLDIPSLPITLQADPQGDSNGAFLVEVHSPVFAKVLEYAHDYLGAALVIDPNATNQSPLDFSDKYGCVRLKLPPRPDPATGKYPALAQFVEDATWNDGVLRQKLNINSYAPIDRGDGVMIPVCPVLGRTMDDQDEPPEGNVVYVTGTVATQSTGLLAVNQEEKLWAIIHNWPAAVFYDGQPIAADPSHPDYTDGSPNLILIIDPSLNTQGAVNFVARRVTDFCTHRRVVRRFEAPHVLVVDPNDPLQIRTRTLMWGDCVLWNQQTWFVSSVNTDASGERGGPRNGSAVYELFRIPALQEVLDGHDSVYHDFQLYGPIASKAA